jgi:hypothetical protein
MKLSVHITHTREMGTAYIPVENPVGERALGN